MLDFHGFVTYSPEKVPRQVGLFHLVYLLHEIGQKTKTVIVVLHPRSLRFHSVRMVGFFIGEIEQ